MNEDIKDIGHFLKEGSEVWTKENGYGTVIKVEEGTDFLMNPTPYKVIHRDGEIIDYSYEGKLGIEEEDKRVLFRAEEARILGLIKGDGK